MNISYLLVRMRGFTDLLCSPRPAPPFSVGLDRSLLDGSPNHLALHSRLFRFESSDYFPAQRKRDVLMNISSLLVRMRGFEPPPKQYRHGPEPCASANSATSAYFVFCCFSTAILEYQIFRCNASTFLYFLKFFYFFILYSLCMPYSAYPLNSSINFQPNFS